MLYARLLQQTLARMIFRSLGINVVPIDIENTDAGLFLFRDIFIRYILVRAPHMRQTKTRKCRRSRWERLRRASQRSTVTVPRGGIDPFRGYV